MSSIAASAYEIAVKNVYTKIIESLQKDLFGDAWEKKKYCEQSQYLNKNLDIEIVLEQPHARVRYKDRVLYLNKKQTDELSAILNFTASKLIEEATKKATDAYLAAVALI